MECISLCGIPCLCAFSTSAFIDSSLHQLDFFLDIFYGDFTLVHPWLFVPEGVRISSSDTCTKNYYKNNTISSLQSLGTSGISNSTWMLSFISTKPRNNWVAAGYYFTRWPPSCKIIIKFMVNNKLWSVRINNMHCTVEPVLGPFQVFTLWRCPDFKG